MESERVRDSREREWLKERKRNQEKTFLHTIFKTTALQKRTNERRRIEKERKEKNRSKKEKEKARKLLRKYFLSKEDDDNWKIWEVSFFTYHHFYLSLLSFFTLSIFSHFLSLLYLIFFSISLLASPCFQERVEV